MKDDYRSKYTVDEDTVNEIQAHYAKIMDQAALNVASPLAANIGYFNNTQKVFADEQRVGKTIVFMTRPNLNLRSLNNMRRSRILNYFSSSALGLSVMRYLMYNSLAADMVYGYYPSDGRVNLKGFSQNLYTVGTCDDTVIGGRVITKNSYPMVKTNFIPMITNLCSTVSPGKDLTMDTVETEGNFSGDRLVYASGIDENFSIGELTLTFDDIYSSPIMILIMTWIMYMHNIGKGLNDPEWAYIVNRIIDYTCSIYVFVLGTDQQTILRWNKYTGAFPRSFPLGQIQHSSEIDVHSLTNVSIPFSYNFSSPMDPIVLTEFNMVAGPSLYNRFVTSQFKNGSGKWKGTLIRGMKGHFMSSEIANLIKEVCPPNELPTKLFTGDYAKNKELVNTFDSAGIDKYSNRRLSLLNRQMDNIENNWAGVPYITEGNKLMWL